MTSSIKINVFAQPHIFFKHALEMNKLQMYLQRNIKWCLCRKGRVGRHTNLRRRLPWLWSKCSIRSWGAQRLSLQTMRRKRMPNWKPMTNSGWKLQSVKVKTKHAERERRATRWKIPFFFFSFGPLSFSFFVCTSLTTLTPVPVSYHSYISSLMYFAFSLSAPAAKDQEMQMPASSASASATAGRAFSSPILSASLNASIDIYAFLLSFIVVEPIPARTRPLQSPSVVKGDISGQISFTKPYPKSVSAGDLTTFFGVAPTSVR